MKSIRWQVLLTFLMILGASFAVMAALLTALVSDNLYAQRTRQASLSAEQLASSAAPFLADADLRTAGQLLHEAAADAQGRILLIDANGKVQYDTFALLEGSRTRVPEAITVLTGEKPHAFAIRTNSPVPADASGENADASALCAAAVSVDGRVIGAVLLITPVGELHGAIVDLQQQLTTVFLGVAVLSLIAAMVFAVTLTRPVQSITRSIRRMARGDLSARVKVHASGEMRELADSYNAMAEKIENFDKSRSQFVQNASHELKTPLATMKILLENLIYQPDMPTELRAEFLQDMNHEIDRLSGIITDLLTLTKMDSEDTVAVNMELISFTDLALETVHALRMTAEKAALTLTHDIAPDLLLMADRSKLGQVVYNLTDNAIKYTPEGGHVHVSLVVQGREAVLSVQDDGIGIPKEDMAHVFDRFYRVDKARSRQSGGTGLGLSIVRQMVQLHGGTVSVSAAPVRGSVFTVVLPITKEASQA